jgi:enoyl-CoA hydratase/carnithine racemase
MELDHLRYGASGGVAEIVLDRPAVLNAISAGPGGTRDQFLHALSLAEADHDVGCVLVRGAGKGFSSGGDITGNPKRDNAFEHEAFVEQADEFHRRIRAASVPTIAAIHGVCMGAGLLLATSCDLVVAARSCRMGLPEGRIGLVGGASLAPIVGRQWAKFLILTGELIDATTACELGLVLAVVDDEVLLDRARELAGRISRMPREATLLNKRAVDAACDAAGDAAARVAAAAHDSITLANSDRATAPDGRSFRAILDAQGMAGMKAARDTQYRDPWL